VSAFDVRSTEGTLRAMGDGVTDDTAAIQAQIAHCLALGGGAVLFPAGTYKLTGPLVINLVNPTMSLTLQGCSELAVTLLQSNPAADVLQIGASDVSQANRIRVDDLSTVGGRYALNLNNALGCSFERLRLNSPLIAIYLQGTNEGHTFRSIQCEGPTQHAIYGAVANSGTLQGVLNLPEVQKCSFEAIRVAGVVTGTAIILTAGILGSQQVSGHNRFTQLLLESNQQSGMELDWATDTWIDGLSTEEALSAPNLYCSLIIDHSSTVYARHLSIETAGVNAPLYGVDVRSGHLSITESTIVGGQTADIHITDNLTLTDSYITSLATLLFDTQAARNASVIQNVRNSSGTLLSWAA
jgi:hypothetical protein